MQPESPTRMGFGMGSIKSDFATFSLANRNKSSLFVQFCQRHELETKPIRGFLCRRRIPPFEKTDVVCDLSKQKDFASLVSESVV